MNIHVNEVTMSYGETASRAVKENQNKAEHQVPLEGRVLSP